MGVRGPGGKIVWWEATGKSGGGGGPGWLLNGEVWWAGGNVGGNGRLVLPLLLRAGEDLGGAGDDWGAVTDIVFVVLELLEMEL